MEMKSRLNPRVGKLVNARSGIIVAASAAAAAASAWERTHRKVQRADLSESPMRVERMADLRDDKDLLATIDQGLRDEWSSFAFLGFESIDEMAARAGRTIFVVVEQDEEGRKARGIVQTILTDVHGDVELLADAYPSFNALTSAESWKSSRSHGGDTAVLLQITTLGQSERGGGLGSLLRNTVLNMLDKSVKFALTATPVDDAATDSLDLEDAATFTAAMRFHARGGALPAAILPGYKTPDSPDPASSHGRDVIVMRYERDAAGHWPDRPLMSVRRVGPLQERLTRAARRLRLRRRLKGIRPHRPSLRGLHKPSVAMPHLQSPHVFDGLKSRASRFKRRSTDQKPPATPTSV
jgi:hypothetical protein